MLAGKLLKTPEGPRGSPFPSLALSSPNSTAQEQEFQKEQMRGGFLLLKDAVLYLRRQRQNGPPRPPRGVESGSIFGSLPFLGYTFRCSLSFFLFFLK